MALLLRRIAGQSILLQVKGSQEKPMLLTVLEVRKTDGEVQLAFEGNDEILVVRHELFVKDPSVMGHFHTAAKTHPTISRLDGLKTYRKIAETPDYQI